MLTQRSTTPSALAHSLRVCYRASLLALLCLLLTACVGRGDSQLGQPCQRHGDCAAPLRCHLRQCVPAPSSDGLSPIAVVRGPTSVTLGKSATFTAAASRFFMPRSERPRWSWQGTPPPESQISLAGDKETFTFLPDRAGVYVLRLQITQGSRKSEPATFSLRVTDNNRPPVAKVARRALRASVGSSLTLDGAGSADPDGDPLRWRWTLRRAPRSSRLRLTEASQSRLRVVLDVPGDFVVALEVRDGRGGQSETLVLLTALPKGSQEAPTLTSAIPATGYLGQVMTWVLRGGPFLKTARVRVEGAPLRSVAVVSTQQLRVVVDLTQAQINTLSLRVENGPGLVSPALRIPLVKAPPPQIWRVSPSVAQPGQRIFLQLSGRDFRREARVFLNGTPLPTTFRSERSLEASWLTQEPGTYTLVVRNPDGQKTAPWPWILSRSKLQLVSSEVVSLAKSCGEQTWTLRGYNFLPGVKASLVPLNPKQTAQPALRLKKTSETSLEVTFDLRQLSTGPHWLTVTNPGTSRGERLLFQVMETSPPPQWYHLTPTTLLPGTETTLTLVGRSLQGFVVQWQGRPLQLTPLNRSTATVTLTVPPNAASGTTPLSLRARCSSVQFAPSLTVLAMPTPVVTEIRPLVRELRDQGPTQIRGAGFHPQLKATLDGAKVTVKVLHSGLLEIPAAALQRPGESQLQLTNPGGKTSSVRIRVNHTPKLEALSPETVSLGAKGIVTLLGQNFAAGVEILVGATPLKGTVRLDDQRVTVPLSLFPTAGKVSLRVRNPGSPPSLSSPLSLTVTTAPSLTATVPLALFAGTLPATVEIRGQNLARGGQLSVQGKALTAGVSWLSSTSIRVNSSAFPTAGDYSLRWNNPNTQGSTPLKITIWPADGLQLEEIRTSNVVLFCGQRLRRASSGTAPRIRFWKGQQSLGSLPGTNSFSLARCLFVSPTLLRYLPAGELKAEVCQTTTQGERCSNRLAWTRPKLPAPRARSAHKPLLLRLRPLSPARWDKLTSAPGKVSFVLEGTSLGGTAKLFWRGQDLAQLPGVTLHRFASGVTVLNAPLPSNPWGAHGIEVENLHGRSNTLFAHLAKNARSVVYRTRSLLLHEDLDHAFSFEGFGLSFTASLRRGGKALIEGGVPLRWSQFLSDVPVLLESEVWTGTSRAQSGPFEVQLAHPEGHLTTVSLRLLKQGQWGTEPLQLHAIDDKAGYARSGGLAPVVGEYVQWRLGVSGVTRQQQIPQVEVWVEGVKQSFVAMDPTSLFGWTPLVLARQDFLGSPRVLPIQLRSANGSRSAIQIATLMPPNSLRLTKVTNATRFSSQLNPLQSSVLEVHGQRLSRATSFFVAGKRARLISLTRDVGTGAEWVRLEVPETGVASPLLPLWAKEGSAVSNTLLVPSRATGIGGVARWRSFSPLRVSLSSLTSLQGRVRVLVEADGLTPGARFLFAKRALPLTRVNRSSAIVEVSLRGVAAGTYTVQLEDKAQGWATPPMKWVIAP